MLSETERRAVRLAQASYRIDTEQIRSAVRAVIARRNQGETVDLVDVLAGQGLLSAEQAQQLQSDLTQTCLDMAAASRLAPPPGLRPAVPRDPEQIGPYRILRRLGEGGMGAVYLAFDKRDERQVAVKVLSPEHADIPGLLHRFRREGASGALLNHPNVVRAYDAGLDEATGLHYLAMEHVDGPNLHSLLERHGRLLVGDAVRIVLDIARALAHAHAHAIIHRDVKPGNILLTSTGRAKLSDLGLVKKLDEVSHLTSARQGVGTPYYVPYEQALNARNADARSDIYALGATLYHLITGEVPFPGASSIEVVQRKQVGVYVPVHVYLPWVPPELEAIVARMLACRPEDRYASAEAVGVELERTGLAAGRLSCIDAGPHAGAEQQTHDDDQGQPTAVDVEAQPQSALWYVRYRDEHGTLRSARLTVNEIVRRLRSGKLSSDAQAAATPLGAFADIGSLPDIGAALADSPPAPASSRWDLWVIAVALTATALALGAAYLTASS
jgi:hypothetical protein